MTDLTQVKNTLRSLRIETPSWAYGNSGTRFKVFAQAGAARNPFEKIADAAIVNTFTGCVPTVAIHIPWDRVDSYEDLAKFAADHGIAIGSINPNLFQDEDYRIGSVCNPDPRVRRKATDHLLECVDIAARTGSEILTCWFPDGTNYAGQDSIRARQDRLAEALDETYAAMPADLTMLIEYKLFEPAFYSMDVPDWGTSLLHCQRLGPQAQVLVDTGHHAPSTNIEMIVALLLREGRLGGFHFNSRYYADDDLMVGAADPFQLFRIMCEIAQADAVDSGVAFMLDQCHNIEPKIAGQIRSIMNVQEALAKALLVDREELAAAQSRGDILAAHGALMDAFATDVRPLLSELREDQGLQPDPMRAYLASGYYETVIDERGTGGLSGWGN
jgi:L-rhamnose isomerase / sugar isomerase